MNPLVVRKEIFTIVLVKKTEERILHFTFLNMTSSIGVADFTVVIISGTFASRDYSVTDMVKVFPFILTLSVINFSVNCGGCLTQKKKTVKTDP